MKYHIWHWVWVFILGFIIGYYNIFRLGDMTVGKIVPYRGQ